MFVRVAKIAAIVLLAASTTACVSTSGQDNGCSSMKSTVGALVGGGLGGLGGSFIGKGNGKTAMTIVGALVGAGMGASAGDSLDKADCTYQNQQRGLQGPMKNSTNPLLMN